MNTQKNNQDLGILKTLILRYQQMVFAFVLYLTGSDQDKAYDICATSFAEALQTRLPLEQDEVFLTRLLGIAVEKSRAVKTIPTFNALDLIDIPVAEKASLHIVLKALQTLDFEAKALILLRAQLNLTYKEIARGIKMSEGEAKRKTIQAQSQLRKEFAEILSKA